MNEVNSTSSVCLDEARDGQSGNLWITANTQLKGKGSRGREWVSDKGNLFTSLLLVEPSEIQFQPTLTFVTSLAIRDAILNVAHNTNQLVNLKWPNDVLINGKKVSGILLESHEVKKQRIVIIGIGMNVKNHPDYTLFPATSLHAENIDCDRDLFFEALAKMFDKRLQQWSKGAGFQSIREDWIKHAFGLDQMIEVKVPGQDTAHAQKGIFKGINDDGLMLMEKQKGIITKISVADIFFA